MIAAVAVLFSTFTTATLAAIFTLSLVVAGHLASDLVRYWATQGTGLGIMGKALYVLVPNLEALNFKEAMVYKDALGAGRLVPSMLYGVLYSIGVAGGRRRDLHAARPALARCARGRAGCVRRPHAKSSDPASFDVTGAPAPARTLAVPHGWLRPRAARTLLLR